LPVIEEAEAIRMTVADAIKVGMAGQCAAGYSR
jgi:hypothetical protein